MKFATAQAFADWPYKAITLMAMSGVGKTTLANRLPKETWFHFSGDYRIGTKYMEEPILDNIKKYAMRDPFLANLLRSDSIYIRSNITVHNLEPLSTFLGKIGNPAIGGLSLEEFKFRQRLHLEAETAAMRDVESFIEKAHSIYGYDYFLNDAGGSVCEITDPDALRVLTERTLILYIATTPDFEEELCRRAEKNPKPLYYDAAFLDRQLADYMQIRGLQDTDEIIPDEFVRWVFPKLIAYRLPRYQSLAKQHGYTVDYRQAEQVRDEQDFLELIGTAIERDRHSD